jgi:CHAT domain-containing protein
MRKVSFILIYCMLFEATCLQGQCLESHSLMNKLIYLSDSKTISRSDQLNELLNLEALQMNCPNKTDSAHWFLLSRIASVYGELGDYLQAVEYCRRSIQMISANVGNPSIRTRDIITGYYKLSVFYEELNNVTRKMKAWDSCEFYAIKLKAEEDISYIRILYAKVEHYYDVGDYQNCVYYATRCRKFAIKYANSAENKDFRQRGIEIAESSLGWNVKALLTINEKDSAEKLLINKVREYKQANLISYLGFIYSFLAEVQEEKGNYPKALFYFNKALQCYRETGNYFSYKQILKQIGEGVYFDHFNDGEKALSYFREALTWVNKDPSESKKDIAESLSILTDIANVYVQKKQYDSAFSYFQLAFNQIQPGITESGLLLIPAEKMGEFAKIHYLTKLVTDKGDAYKHEFATGGNTKALREAIRVYKAADQLLDRVRMEQSDLNSKLFWRYDTRRLYEHAIEASTENGDMEDAFYFFERSRASLLNDQLNEQHWLEEEDISKLTQLRKTILRLNTELDKTDNSNSRIEEIRNEQFNKRKELADLEQLIKLQNPLYYHSFLDKSKIQIQDVRKKLLKDHQAIVELFTGDSANYSLVITPQKTYVYKIDKSKFDHALNQFMNYVSNPVLLRRKSDDFTTVSHQLYQLLFQNQDLPEGRIIFSQEDRYFPLEALVTSNPKDELTYFQSSHAVSYTYSVRYLMSDMRKSASMGSNDFMGVAPVQYQTSSISLSALTGSELSLNQISSHFKKEFNLIGSRASKNNFIQHFSNYRIIQIYTHSSDTSDRGEPVMYFADSALYLSELIPQNIPVTQLIVLSACETGLGRVYKGEGIFSFNRGFAALGIPSAITNLWAVDDQATYLLTQLFYKYLSLGMPTDIALQKAKLEFVQTGTRERQLPYYWAAAILVGKTDTILMKKTFPWEIFTLVAVFAGLAVFLTWSWRKRKRKILSIQ